MDELKEIARKALKGAKAAGVITEFTVRKEGRATIRSLHLPGRKYYTTGAMDTLEKLSRLEQKAKLATAGISK